MSAFAAAVLAAQIRRDRAPQTAPPVPQPRRRAECAVGGASVEAVDWPSLIHREVRELATLVDHLYGMQALEPYESEVAEVAFVRLDDLRWLLADYVLTGGRIRRLVELPALLEVLDGAALFGSDELGSECAGHPAYPARVEAEALLERIRRTNAATADWLLLHRIALPDPDFLDSNALLGRYGTLQIDPTSIAGDPLYLLTCHLHDLLDAVDRLGDIEHPVFENLENTLACLLGVIADEIDSAQRFNSAIISLAREVRSADA
ncbi:MAG: hypothetical protein U0R77_07875 [Mycolicibacterium insubricum]|nr:hypothetical protein [Mycobacterium sp.]